MAKDKINVLTEEYLYELFFGCFEYDYVCGTVCEYMHQEYLPGRDYQSLLKYIKAYYKEHKSAPTSNIMAQIASSDRNVISLLRDIKDSAECATAEAIIEQFEEYIRQVRFQKTYKEMGELYVKQDKEKAMKLLSEFAEWQSKFTLKTNTFVDIASTFGSRFTKNRDLHNQESKLKTVNRFYIDELDNRNEGRDLRGQLTCFLASTGVGKSHIIRWIGRNCAWIDGLNVLHFQLEGSEEEVTDAYSAAIVGCNAFSYSCGTITDRDMNKMVEKVNSMSGTIKVKTYPKFANKVSTIDIKNSIDEYEKEFKRTPDVVLIDSMDLLEDSTGKKWSENGERYKRTNVANDLKDLASDKNIWIAVTYQSTIENRDWINDEKNVLTEYNCSEAKGLSRPLTHLITLNQSMNEAHEETMRLNIAKSRFFKKGSPFKIATNYKNETFYDRERTMDLLKLSE